MKKWTLIVSSIILIVVLAACGNSGSQTKSSSKSSASSQNTMTKQQQKAQKQMQADIKKSLVDDNKTVAIVNGTKISGKEYNAAYQSVAQQLYMSAQQQGQKSKSSDILNQAKQETINTLVGQKLILQDAKAKGYKATSKQVQDQYDKMEKQYGGQKKMAALLKSHNLTTASVKNNISQQIVFSDYVKKEIGQPKVTDKEIQQYYDQYSQSQKNAPKLKDVKTQIKQQIIQQKQNHALAQIVDKLKKKGSIEIKM